MERNGQPGNWPSSNDGGPSAASSRITKNMPGTDGHVRSVEIQVKNRTYIRPVARLIPLPEMAERNGQHGNWPSSNDGGPSAALSLLAGGRYH